MRSNTGIFPWTCFSDELGARSRVDLWGDVASADLSQISDVLDEQDAALLERMKSASRAARDVTDFAQTECQELLKLFGIPFIVSPQVRRVVLLDIRVDGCEMRVATTMV